HRVAIKAYRRVTEAEVCAARMVAPPGAQSIIDQIRAGASRAGRNCVVDWYGRVAKVVADGILHLCPGPAAPIGQRIGRVQTIEPAISVIALAKQQRFAQTIGDLPHARAPIPQLKNIEHAAVPKLAVEKSGGGILLACIGRRMVDPYPAIAGIIIRSKDEI